jgi:hypothetical protein
MKQTGAIINAVLVFVTFVIGLPGAFDPLSRLWLKLQGWMTVVCATFTLILGLDIWFQTLTTRARLDTAWGTQSHHMQSLLQQKVMQLSLSLSFLSFFTLP